jgi:hypothetical protein
MGGVISSPAAEPSVSNLPSSPPYLSSPPQPGAGPSAGVLTVHVPRLEAKDLAEMRLAVSRAPATATIDRRARHRLWGCLAIVALLVGPVVASGNRPDLTLAGVLLGFVAGVLVIIGELRKAADEVVAVTYWFDPMGIRWQNPSMEGRTSWADVWLVEGERCLVIVKGSSLILAVPKREAHPDLVARVVSLATASGATFDPEPLGSTAFA